MRELSVGYWGDPGGWARRTGLNLNERFTIITGGDGGHSPMRVGVIGVVSIGGDGHPGNGPAGVGGVELSDGKLSPSTGSCVMV